MFLYIVLGLVLIIKIINMDSADKFDIFLRVCKWIFLILLVLKLLGFITISYWIVFLPIIIPIILILKELGAFN